jgi:hypothetical protein
MLCNLGRPLARRKLRHPSVGEPKNRGRGWKPSPDSRTWTARTSVGSSRNRLRAVLSNTRPCRTRRCRCWHAFERRPPGPGGRRSS